MNTSDKLINKAKIIAIHLHNFLLKYVYSDRNITYIKELLIDIKRSFINLLIALTKLKNPSKKDWKILIIEEIIATGTGWTAGIFASDWVSSNYKFKSSKNLWGLTGRRDGREMLSREDYELYDWWASYLIGLIMMFIVRYLVLQLMHEFEKVREARQSDEDESPNLSL